MAILVSGSSATFGIGTSEIDLAAQIGMSTSDKAEHLLIVQNVGATNVYLGPTGSAVNGYELTGGNEIHFRVPAGDRLYGVTSSGSTTVRLAAVRG